jgi:riboflavin kinase / FMN adenylyltransferase
MLHHSSLKGLHLQGVWLTIGSFDGVHTGHQAILRKVVAGAHAAGAPSVVLTFFPHPSNVLRGRTGPFYLTSPEERAFLLGQQGVDHVITLEFDQSLASQTAHSFVQMLHHHLGLRHLCIGHDFALGRGRQGDLPFLQNLGKELDFSVNVMRPIRYAGQVVSSSRVRAVLADGNVQQAKALLGRHYQVEGEVVAGDGRGRTIGIPTANLNVWPERLLPKSGVYACLACVNGQTRRAVANIGVRPTFESQEALPRLEAHLLDYAADLYGKNLTLRFVAHLRDEQRFANIQALVNQIQTDISKAKKILRVK